MVDADGGAVKVGVLLDEVDMELPDSRFDDGRVDWREDGR